MSTNQTIIGTYTESTSAHLARAQLSAEGIESWLVDEFTSDINPLHTPVIGGVKLAVREEDAAAALRFMQGVEVSEQERYEQNLYQCPMCGSKNVGENAMRFLWLLLLTLLTFGLYLSIFYKRHKCGNCGSVW